MKVMREPIDGWSSSEPLAVAVGVFDGVHRGHQHVLTLLAEQAQRVGVAPAVLTFDPHPLAVLAPERAPRRLTTIAQRIELFADMGIEVVAVLPFTPEVQAMTAGAFVHEIMLTRLNARVVVAGADFRFGVGRTGDVALLEQMGPEAGFEFVPGQLIGEGEPYSSTSVRRALVTGEVELAASVLGRPFELAAAGASTSTIGDVLTGRLKPEAISAVPCDGAYAGRWGTAPAAVVVGDGHVEMATTGQPIGDGLQFVRRLAERPGSPAIDHLDEVARALA